MSKTWSDGKLGGGSPYLRSCGRLHGRAKDQGSCGSTGDLGLYIISQFSLLLSQKLIGNLAPFYHCDCIFQPLTRRCLGNSGLWGEQCWRCLLLVDWTDWLESWGQVNGAIVTDSKWKVSDFCWSVCQVSWTNQYCHKMDIMRMQIRIMKTRRR